MFVKFINTHKVEQPPKHLYTTKEIDGEIVEFLVCSRTEEVLNKLGYYKMEIDPYPSDTEYNYTPWYEEATPSRLYHIQHWERGEKIEPVESQPTELQQAFNTLKECTENATTIKALRDGIDLAASKIGEES